MTDSTNKTVIKIVVSALAALFVLLIIALIINLVKLSAVNDRRDRLKAQSERLDEVIDSNGKMLDYVESPEFIESYAREYLDMIYRDEIVIDVD